jgi:hypothetical protein
MKSVISKDIFRLLTDEIEALCNIPSNLLLNDLMKFNREKHQAQICRLINIKILKYNQTKKIAQ